MRIVDFLDRGARMHPERAFCIDGAEVATYAQARDSSRRMCSALLKLGVERGTKVSVYAPNCAAALTCIYAANRAGAVWVPLNPRNGTEENVYVLESFDVEVVLYHSSLKASIETYRQRATHVKHFISIDGQGPGSLAEWMDNVPLCEPLARFDSGQLASILPTGGTTGKPKGVMLSNLSWTAQIANVTAALPASKPVVHLVVAPLTHAAGAISIILTAHGATHVILDGFDVENVMRSIEHHRITHLFLPPTALYMMLAHPKVREFDYSSLEYFLYGAAPASPERIEEAISVFGPVMAQAYGQTEAPTACTFLPPKDHMPSDPALRHRMRSCGRPAVLTDIRIASAEGVVLSPCQTGEVQIRGPLLMDAYYKNEEATRNALKDGWLRTGDIGYMDADGYLYIVDRLKDMIISGGFNIYPSEVEQVVWALDGVQDCAVIGVPDEKWGEAVKCIVQPKPGHTLDPDALLATCRERLGSVKAPKTLEIWSELPRSANGKILKREIRERFWQSTGRRI